MRSWRLAAVTWMVVLAVAGCMSGGQDADRLLETGAGTAGPDTAEPWDWGVPVLAFTRLGRQYEVLAIDPASGQQVAGRAPISMGSGRYAPAYALSADNRRLAVISGEGASCEPYAGGTSCRSRAEVIHIIDLQAWREVSGTLPATGWAGPAAFSPDGQRVALAISKAAGATLVMIDTGSGETLAQRQVEFLPSLLGFTSSASGGAGELVAYGQAPGPKPGIDPPDPPQVMVVDAKTLATRWVSGLEGVASGTWCVENCDAKHGAPLTAYWDPAVVLAPDGHSLAVVHADAERLTLVNVAERTVRSFEITRAQSWLDSLLSLDGGVAYAKGPMAGAIKTGVFSTDSTWLYVAGQTMDTASSTQTGLGVQAIDVKNGRVVIAAAADATHVRATSDGRYLLAEHWRDNGPSTEVLATNDLSAVATVTGWEVLGVRHSGGELALVARLFDQKQTTYALLDARSLQVMSQWQGGEYWTWLAAP